MSSTPTRPSIPDMMYKRSGNTSIQEYCPSKEQLSSFKEENLEMLDKLLEALFDQCGDDNRSTKTQGILNAIYILCGADESIIKGV